MGKFLVIQLKFWFSSASPCESQIFFPSDLAFRIILSAIVHIMSITVQSSMSDFLASGGLGHEKIQISGVILQFRLRTFLFYATDILFEDNHKLHEKSPQ